MAATQDTQQATQGRIDPRRLGRNNSGLTEQDVSDVVCILHPSSPAAFHVVKITAQRNAQHVLQNQGLTILDPNDDGVPASEADTILVKSMSVDGPRDLALRFSSRVSDPTIGFCFGRNQFKCDINLDPEATQRRVSNTHFRIFINENGVLMLEDMSTNGTVVDGKTLGGRKTPNANPKAIMLQHGSIIEILSPNQDDVIKFISREPARENFMDQYAQKFQAYMAHVAIATQRAVAAQQGVGMPEAACRAVMAAPLAGPVNTKAIPTPAPPTMSSRYPMHWDGGGKYSCVGLLGKGAFATVYQIATKHGGEYFAAKELEKKRFVKNGVLDERLDNEMTIMRALRHDNIVQYIDYVETKNHLYIIMEYIPGGDLQGYTQSHGTLPEELARGMTTQILHALHYLHKRNITHRDIKPDNILICSESPFTVKLTDFGLSKVVKNNETFLKTFCGTLLYCAPEVFPHYDNYVAIGRPKKRKSTTTRRSYSQLVDIWSYAAVLWTALCGRPPFEGVVDANGRGMFDKIMSSPVDKSPLVEYGVSDDASDLLLLMLDTDPATRPSEAECLRHPWLNDGIWGEGSDPEEEGDTSLQPIAEDEEGAEELDASQLEINDPHEQLQSTKRFKQGFHTLRDHSTEEASEEGIDFVSIPLVNEAYKHTPKAPKLFGEISQPALGPALQSSGALTGPNVHPTAHGSWDESSNGGSGYGDSRILKLEHELVEDRNLNGLPHRQDKSRRQQANTSLGGAESMVRELHMASPKDGNSAAHTPENHRTPVHSQDSLDGTKQTKQRKPGTPQEETPRPRQFDRRISLPITASSYYDPFDPRTHNVEYASNVSGHDFKLEPSTTTNGVTSLPETVHQSFPSSGSSRRSQQSLDGTSDHQSRSSDQQPQQAVAGADPITLPGPHSKHKMHAPAIPSPLGSQNTSLNAPTRTAGTSINTNNSTNAPNTSDTDLTAPLALLTSTADSFASVAIPLVSRTTTWGRHPTVTVPYPHQNDTRVPKIGLELYFDAPGIAEAKDWRTLKSLKLYVLTRGRNPIKINNVKLTEWGDKGGGMYGRLCDGDVIEIHRSKVAASGVEERGLSFVVQIFAENVKWKRKPGEPFRTWERPSQSLGNAAPADENNTAG